MVRNIKNFENIGEMQVLPKRVGCVVGCINYIRQ